MQHVTLNSAIKDFNHLMDNVTRYGEQVTIVSDTHGAAILVGMDEWRGMQETLYLHSIPGMVESIVEAASQPNEDCVRLDEVDFGV